MDKYIEDVYEKKFAFADKPTEEATKIKYTINKCLEIFRDIFSADACYLYLINDDMDDFEKEEIFNERIKEMKEAYDKAKAKAGKDETIVESPGKTIFPDNLYNFDSEKNDANSEVINSESNQSNAGPEVINYNSKKNNKSFKILKFIDVSQKKKEDGTYYWNYDYRNRPGKYVIFTQDKYGKKITKDKIIYNEGLTAYIYRTQEESINIKEDVEKNDASASLNSKHNIKPPSKMSIGIPLRIPNEKRSIGVITVEYYDMNKEYSKEKIIDRTKEGNINKTISVRDKIDEAYMYLPLLVQLIRTSESQFKKDSYDTLFGGMRLLDCLKKLDVSSENKFGKINKETNYINKKIYIDTLHLFYVLKRREYVGYEEILGRVAEYANDISKYLGISSESKLFTDFLEKFKKHEELLLYGLNDFRDHFMHQFHVFVSGYIIINLLDFDKFQGKIENSMANAFDKSKEQLNISEFNVLRIWFLVSFFHDHAYLFEKIDVELENFFKSTFDQELSVNFNWEQLLKKESKFLTHLTNLQTFYCKQEKTNPEALMKNYLDSIVNTHDHGVLSALLLLNYFSEMKDINSEYGSIKDDCLYAAFAISVHNQYDNLMEKGLTQISFESFPIAFLLSYCDTAQSFGRVGKKQDYPSRFLDIDFSENRIVYRNEYLENGKDIPSPEIIEKWAKKAHHTFKSSTYFFDIENYEANMRHICTLSYGFYRELPDQCDTIPFIISCPIIIDIGNEDIIEYCKVDNRGYPIFKSHISAPKAMVIVGKRDKNNLRITKNDKVFICFSDKHGCLSSIGKELAGQEITVIIPRSNIVLNFTKQNI